MPKFYASCGSNAVIVDALTADQAAMRLIDEAMAPHAWIYEDPDLSPRECRDHLVLEALMHLGSTVAVSEQGFGRAEVGSFEVPELLNDWHKLMTAIRGLFVAVGLNPQRVLPQLPSATSAGKRPR